METDPSPRLRKKEVVSSYPMDQISAETRRLIENTAERLWGFATHTFRDDMVDAAIQKKIILYTREDYTDVPEEEWETFVLDNPNWESREVAFISGAMTNLLSRLFSPSQRYVQEALDEIETYGSLDRYQIEVSVHRTDLREQIPYVNWPYFFNAEANRVSAWFQNTLESYGSETSIVSALTSPERSMEFSGLTEREQQEKDRILALENKAMQDIQMARFRTDVYTRIRNDVYAYVPFLAGQVSNAIDQVRQYYTLAYRALGEAYWGGESVRTPYISDDGEGDSEFLMYVKAQMDREARTGRIYEKTTRSEIFMQLILAYQQSFLQEEGSPVVLQRIDWTVLLGALKGVVSSVPINTEMGYLIVILGEALRTFVQDHSFEAGLRCQDVEVVPAQLIEDIGNYEAVTEQIVRRIRNAPPQSRERLYTTSTHRALSYRDELENRLEVVQEDLLSCQEELMDFLSNDERFNLFMKFLQDSHQEDLDNADAAKRVPTPVRSRSLILTVRERQRKEAGIILHEYAQGLPEISARSAIRFRLRLMINRNIGRLNAHYAEIKAQIRAIRDIITSGIRTRKREPLSGGEGPFKKPKDVKARVVFYREFKTRCL